MDIQNLSTIIDDLVSFQTVYPNKNEFLSAIQYIKEYFDGCELSIKDFEFNNSPSLVICNCPATHFDVVFCGHIDVVPAAASFFKMKRDGDILYGRGVSDMKGQVAVMMQLMKKISAEKMQRKIALFLTSDEERGGFDGVNRLLKDAMYSSKVAIIPDGGFDYALVEEAKGVLQIKVTAMGVESHSSEPWKGTNAILKLCNMIKTIEERFPRLESPSDWRSSFTVSKIEGGDSINKVPSCASMCIDIRHIYADKVDCILDFIKNIDPTIDIQLLAQGEPFILHKHDAYVEKYIDICQAFIQKNVNIIKCHSASDGRFFSQKNIPCLIMNPVGGNIHCDDEWVSLRSLCMLRAMYEKYLQELP